MESDPEKFVRGLKITAQPKIQPNLAGENPDDMVESLQPQETAEDMDGFKEVGDIAKIEQGSDQKELAD